MTSGVDPLAMIVEPLRRRHLKAVRSIDAVVYPRPWSLALYLQELNNQTSRVYRIVRAGQRIVGYAGLMVVGPDGHITSVATEPAWQGGGVASRALIAVARGALEKGCRALTLEVRESNDRAQRLYERFGFESAGVRKNYYTDAGEDAVIMWANEIDTPDFRQRLRDIEAGLHGATEWRSS